MATSNQVEKTKELPEIIHKNIFDCDVFSISAEESLENITFLKIFLEKFDFECLEKKLNSAHDILVEFCNITKLKINKITEIQIKEAKEKFKKNPSKLGYGKMITIPKDNFDFGNELIKFIPRQKDDRDALFSVSNKEIEPHSEKYKRYDKLEKAEDRNHMDFEHYENIALRNLVGSVSKKSMLLNKLTNLGSKCNELCNFKIENLKSSVEIDKKLNELFEIKTNLEHLSKEIDFFIFNNEKIEIKFDKNNISYLFHNHLIQFASDNQMSMIPYFEQNNLKLERSFNKRVFFKALPNEKLVFVYFENGLNHSRVIVYNPSNKLCVTKDIDLKYIFKLRNLNNYIVINGFDNLDQKIVMILKDNLEIEKQKFYQYDELLCLTQDAAYFHEKSFGSSFKIIENFFNNPNIKQITIQNEDKELPFFMNFKDFFKFIQFEYIENRYFIRAYADDDLDQFIFIYDMSGEFINKIEVNGRFEVNSNGIFVLEGEYLIFYTLNGKPKEQYEILRSNKNYQDCPLLSFSIANLSSSNSIQKLDDSTISSNLESSDSDEIPDDCNYKIYFFDGCNINQFL